MNKLNISLVITLVTILLSAGGSIALVKAKTDKIDEIEKALNLDDKKIAIIETQMKAIDDNLKENKEDVDEIQADIKTILRTILNGR